MLWRVLVCVLSVLGLSGSSPQLSQAGVFQIAGDEPAVCMGVPVSYATLPNTPAMLDPYKGLVVDPQQMVQYAGIVQRFIFYHECGHTRIGPSEYGADCWSVQHGIQNGWLRERDLAKICLSFNSKGSVTHPSRSERCANIHRCFSQAKKDIAYGHGYNPDSD